MSKNSDLREASDVVTLMHENARVMHGHTAFTMVRDIDREPGGVTVSYDELDREARRIASKLQASYAPGDRMLLLYSDISRFVIAFFACLYSGMIAVPAPPPGRNTYQRRRVTSIALNAAISAVLSDSEDLPAITEWASSELPTRLDCVETDSATLGEPDSWAMPRVNRDTLALLQYTSGSTGEPKGVMVTHRNLLHNVESMRRAFGLTQSTRIGGWIPYFHDMGLIGQLLAPALLKSSCSLMSPAAFLKRPHTWLQMIDKHNVTVSAGPNFAYELCRRRIPAEKVAELDLSRWEVAVNGSEPIQASTLTAFTEHFAPAGFRARTFAPCFGLAEATLFASGAGGRPPVLRQVDTERLEDGHFEPTDPTRPQRALVSCGPPMDVQIQIVDPKSHEKLPDGMVGEIWLRGESIAVGYWRPEQDTDSVFGASVVGGDTGYLRTGDLGAIYDQELYVTGRIKEVLIIRGRNIYPQDIEGELRAKHPQLSGGTGAVFTVPSSTGRSVDDELVVTHEIRGRFDEHQLRTVAMDLRQTVAQEFGLHAACVVLLRPGGVLRTTSGKVQRSAMRQSFLADRLARRYTLKDPYSSGETTPMRSEHAEAREKPGR
ncbi:AMP-binding protein [Rugosimonospora africana]|uniref:AMP-binding protein n=2 Tax=Rugosimonospora africana TaxID=556532 RepID=A0A8J3R2M0_9ACTN|nr:AMP-binding protein [Rugosimonospora africana]